MSQIEFNIILRKPKYPVIVVSNEKLYSAFNIKQLAKIIIEFTTNPKMIKYMSKNAELTINKYSINTAIEGTLQAFNFVRHNGTGMML